MRGQMDAAADAGTAMLDGLAQRRKGAEFKAVLCASASLRDDSFDAVFATL